MSGRSKGGKVNAEATGNDDADGSTGITESAMLNAVTEILLPQSIPIPPLLKWIAQYETPCFGPSDCASHALHSSHVCVILVSSACIVVGPVLESVGKAVVVAGSNIDTSKIDGSGEAARFNAPFGLELSVDGEYLLVADTLNSLIRRIGISDSIVSAGGGGGGGGSFQVTTSTAAFRYPTCIRPNPVAVAGGVEEYWVTVPSSISKFRPIPTGTGTSQSSPLSSASASALGVDKSEKADAAGQEEVVTRVVGSSESGFEDGDFTAARFNNCLSLAVTRDGQTLYVVESTNHCLRCVSLVDQRVKTCCVLSAEAVRKRQSTRSRTNDPDRPQTGVPIPGVY